MKLSIKDFFSKFNRIRSCQRIWSHLLKKFLMEMFIFYSLRSVFPNQNCNNDSRYSFSNYSLHNLSQVNNEFTRPHQRCIQNPFKRLILSFLKDYVPIEKTHKTLLVPSLHLHQPPKCILILLKSIFSFLVMEL